jgi:hypothetical protein
MAWILNTAYLVKQGHGGNIEFEDPVMIETDFTVENEGKGLRPSEAVRRPRWQRCRHRERVVRRRWVRSTRTGRSV